MLGLGLIIKAGQRVLGGLSALLKTLIARATYSENTKDSDATVKAIEDAGVLDKATILLTPTATSDARVHSVKTYTGENVLTGDNSTFDSGIGDWQVYNGASGASVAHSTDKLEVTLSSGEGGARINTSSLFTGGQAGKTLKIRARIWQGTYPHSSISIYVGGVQKFVSISSTPTYFEAFLKPTSTGYLTIYRAGTGSTGTYFIDDVSVVDVSSDFNFDRASSATRINSDGLVQDIVSDLARINYDSNGDNGHILLEPSSTNLVTYSEDFDETTSDWANTNVSVEKNSTISPQGINNAAKITEDTSNDTHRLQFYFSQTINTNYSYSIFVKANGRNYCGINIGASRLFANFDLINETVTRVSSNGTDFNNESASIIAFGNGWYKCTLSGYALTTSGGYIRFALRNISSTSSSLSYLGDGVSGAYVWGAQLEALPYATSYIPNHGTAAGVTRATETLTGSGNSTLINSTEGVLYAEIAMLSEDDKSADNQIAISDGTTDNRILIFTDGSGDVQVLLKDDTEVTKTASLRALDQSQVGVDTASFNKIAIQYKSGENKLFVNGSEITNSNFNNFVFDYSATTLNNLEFGSGANSNYFRGKCKALAVFNEALSDTELTNLTS